MVPTCLCARGRVVWHTPLAPILQRCSQHAARQRAKARRNSCQSLDSIRLLIRGECYTAIIPFTTTTTTIITLSLSSSVSHDRQRHCYVCVCVWLQTVIKWWVVIQPRALSCLRPVTRRNSAECDALNLYCTLHNGCHTGAWVDTPVRLLQKNAPCVALTLLSSNSVVEIGKMPVPPNPSKLKS